MQKASLCGLGQSAPNPVVSTLKYFEEEYKEHIVDKRCRAGKCTHLASYSIIQDKCKKCGLCEKNCPFKAITGDRTVGYTIHAELCTKCGRCLETCKFKAIKKE
jgi:NADH-quinone oxidoreductase subunit F